METTVLTNKKPKTLLKEQLAEALLTEMIDPKYSALDDVELAKVAAKSLSEFCDQYFVRFTFTVHGKKLTDSDTI